MGESDIETMAALARNRVAGSLERNGLAENGFDLLKGIGIGFVLGRVSSFDPGSISLCILQFRAVPLVLGVAAGVTLDSYFRLPEMKPIITSTIEKMTTKE